MHSSKRSCEIDPKAHWGAGRTEDMLRCKYVALIDERTRTAMLNEQASTYKPDGGKRGAGRRAHIFTIVCVEYRRTA